MIEKIIRYFDLQSENRTVEAQGHASQDYAPVIPQYMAVVFGIILEPFLKNYISSGSWDIDYRFLFGRAVFAIIMAVIILPGLYKSSFDEKKPLFIQIAALVPMGMGWQSLFSSASKVIGV